MIVSEMTLMKFKYVFSDINNDYENKMPVYLSLINKQFNKIKLRNTFVLL